MLFLILKCDSEAHAWQMFKPTAKIEKKFISTNFFKNICNKNLARERKSVTTNAPSSPPWASGYAGDWGSLTLKLRWRRHPPDSAVAVPTHSCSKISTSSKVSAQRNTPAEPTAPNHPQTKTPRVFTPEVLFKCQAILQSFVVDCTSFAITPS